MKKLTLSLDALRVDSFTTLPQLKGRGTVEGHNTAECTVETCGPYTCGPDTFYDTCTVTGAGTCGDTNCTCSQMEETCGGSECFSYYTDCHRC